MTKRVEVVYAKSCTSLLFDVSAALSYTRPTICISATEIGTCSVRYRRKLMLQLWYVILGYAALHITRASPGHVSTMLPNASRRDVRNDRDY
jgi:hypothetical protein